MPRKKIKIGKMVIAEEIYTEEEKEEVELANKWARSRVREALDKYAGEPIDKVPEKYRKQIEELRKLGQFGKKKSERIKTRMKDAVGRQVANNDTTREELGISKEINNNKKLDER